MPSILETCGDPVETRRRSAFEPTPCYRCLAYRPDTLSGCHLIEVNATPKPKPKRRQGTDQTTIW